jgi:hypothetical protein
MTDTIPATTGPATLPDGDILPITPRSARGPGRPDSGSRTGPKMADPVDLALVVRDRLRKIDEGARKTAETVAAAALLNPDALALVLDVTKLGAVDQARWTSATRIAHESLG